MKVLAVESAGNADAQFGHVLMRAKADFLEMPDLVLTPAQAARFWAADRAICDAVLAALVETRFLVRTGDAFVRA
jgi:hypothetical protein